MANSWKFLQKLLSKFFWYLSFLYLLNFIECKETVFLSKLSLIFSRASCLMLKMSRLQIRWKRVDFALSLQGVSVMMLHCRTKNEVKRSSQSRDILRNKIKQPDLLIEFWDQNSRTKLLNYLKQLHQFTVSIVAYTH